ncbi:heavy-metal-associated domain-containing protein [Paracoccus sp. (in: a-proteobacteria)]|uniref:heavy-metal-associated domain-containing protein n=1 Tax=Paracoccus sp. TaxID=267 RepID=UPI0026E02F39|nr:heavy-metal-associated domain-containing protein [Paracoccus sp. (in: a-proteobacteria)]MDO5371588.1 heavy-metal-associated domain-containing protein [Paracoccus sp. (in: a-proteobacteria)]
MKFHVEDMSCGHCTAAIESAIAGAGGTAKADLDSRTVTVDGIGSARAAELIKEAGYTAVPVE